MQTFLWVNVESQDAVAFIEAETHSQAYRKVLMKRIMDGQQLDTAIRLSYKEDLILPIDHVDTLEIRPFRGFIPDISRVDKNYMQNMPKIS